MCYNKLGECMIKIKIGIRIKQIRNGLKMSQEELAQILDCDRAYISRVESGKQNITIENLENICRALHISMKDFFREID